MSVRPVAGPLFRKAAGLDIGGGKRRKVLALVAAYFDGGADLSPPITELAERAQLPVPKLCAVCDRLVADGWLADRSSRARKRRYVLGEWAS
jgi:DNA-binding IclR family transcriptional regulator